MSRPSQPFPNNCGGITNMYAWRFLFMFCVFIPLTYQGVAGNSGNVRSNGDVAKPPDEESSSSAELVGLLDAAGRNQSEAEGPPDSHEAMNNRELKPKLTIGNRRKRSYEFLMGLVKRNSSLYPITTHTDGVGPSVSSPDSDAKASELLLELLVKIAANPQQWSKVHELLQKVDKDLIKSKELVDNIKSSASGLADDVTRSKTKPEQAFDVITPPYPYETVATKYPWQLASTKPASASYQKNFAYHRVTGNPLTHSPAASNKNPKAYIAVSVIAPKPMHGQGNAAADDLTLENELKELKPWSHQQNLKNMAEIRSRWVIQNDKKPLYAP